MSNVPGGKELEEQKLFEKNIKKVMRDGEIVNV